MFRYYLLMRYLRYTFRFNGKTSIRTGRDDCHITIEIEPNNLPFIFISPIIKIKNIPYINIATRSTP